MIPNHVHKNSQSGSLGHYSVRQLKVNVTTMHAVIIARMRFSNSHHIANVAMSTVKFVACLLDESSLNCKPTLY